MKPWPRRLAEIVSSRSLFLKIFGWFWAAQILIGGALYLLAAATQRGFDQRFIEITSENLESKTYTAAVAYEAGGMKALQEAWRMPRDFDGGRSDFNGDGGRRGRFGPDDFNGDDHYDGPRHGPRDGFRPDALREVSFYVLRGHPSQFQAVLLAGPKPPLDLTSPPTQNQTMFTVNGRTWLARRTDTTKGGHYLGVVQLRSFGMRPGGGFFDQWLPTGSRPGPGGWLRIVVVALTMGAVCYALARYLTDPAIKLRRAAQEFASGNLSARVGPQMGRRRDELADLGHDFDQMAERIESLLLAERRLLGDISHELRSPLTRLCLALELAEQTADPQTRESLGRIGSEAQEINNLIGQLLTLTRLENTPSIANSRDSNDAAIIDLAYLVEHVCDNANFEAQSRDGEVTVLRADECQIVGNGELLRSAIENVVRNAILHSPQKPQVEVSLQVAELEDKTKAPPDATQEAIIRVRDYGRGVPEESLELLFSPFYRVAVDRARQSGGTGLGLSITQRAVQFHGGQVKAQNAPNMGLIVEIRLPLVDELDSVLAQSR